MTHTVELYLQLSDTWEPVVDSKVLKAFELLGFPAFLTMSSPDGHSYGRYRTTRDVSPHTRGASPHTGDTPVETDSPPAAQSKYSLELHMPIPDLWEPIVDEEVLEAFKILHWPDKMTITRKSNPHTKNEFVNTFRLVTQEKEREMTEYSLECLNKDNQWEPVECNQDMLKAFELLGFPHELTILHKGITRDYRDTYRLVTQQEYEVEVTYTVTVQAESEEAARQQIEESFPHDAYCKDIIIG